MSWGYDVDNGPATWYKDFPIANGKRQSPIDIVPGSVTFDAKLATAPLIINYKTESKLEASNTGKSIKVQATQQSEIRGGPLAGTYLLEQFHFHWGKNDKKGSEHTVNGKMYASELHLVHYNSSKYKSFAEAADKPDGLAVFAFFIKVGAKHIGMKELTDTVILNIREQGKSCKVSGLNMSSLLCSDMTKYWTYDGSLTTPPLYESVKWIVFKEPIEMSDDQLHALRTLRCGSKCILDNFRPPVPLGARTVRASFKS